MAGWKQAVADVGERAAGVSRKLHRKIVIKASVQIVTALVVGLLKLTEEQNRKCREALDEWEQDWEKKAKDPEYIPDLDPQFKIQDSEAQFLSEIVPGLDDFFLCRHRTCMFVGRNTDWVPNMMDSQYACPMCGEQFRPWKEQPGYVKSNKVLVMQQTTTDSKMMVLGPDAAATLQATEGAPNYIPGIGNYYIFPIVWADTATQVLQNKFKSITANLDETLAQMTDNKARMEYVLDSLQDKRPHALFTPMQMSEVAKMNLDDKNQKASNPDRRWNYQRILESGFLGMNCAQHSEAFDLPLEQEDIIRIWGLCKWFFHQSRALQ